MSYKTIILEKKDKIATITLNRPDRFNALNADMMVELPEALENADKDKDIRVVVITGAGKGFCSGADVKDNFVAMIEKRKRGELDIQLGTEFGDRMWAIFRNTGKPIIAAINGPAVGFGCTLALACDIRIASEDARLGVIFTRVGLTPEFGSTFLLPRLVGVAKACELIFTAKVIDAKEAKEIGLVNNVVPQSELISNTMEMAKTIAAGPPIAIHLAKKALYQGLQADLNTQLRYEDVIFRTCQLTKDHEEGARAFLEKRNPVFKGE